MYLVERQAAVEGRRALAQTLNEIVRLQDGLGARDGAGLLAARLEVVADAPLALQGQQLLVEHARQQHAFEHAQERLGRELGHLRRVGVAPPRPEFGTSPGRAGVVLVRPNLHGLGGELPRAAFVGCLCLRH
jgi:hypothetical protein